MGVARGVLAAFAATAAAAASSSLDGVLGRGAASGSGSGADADAAGAALRPVLIRQQGQYRTHAGGKAAAGHGVSSAGLAHEMCWGVSAAS